MKESWQKKCGKKFFGSEKDKEGEKIISVNSVKKPLISVIIPTLNEENYIEDTLLSLKWQNFEFPYEIIVVDSNSKDNTVKIAKKYANKIIVTKKKGVAKGRNLGAKYAEGKYLVFVDADTILLPNALEKLYKEIRNPTVALVSLPVLPSCFDSVFLFYYFVYSLFSKISIIFGKPQIAGIVMCCRKETFFKVGGFGEDNIVLEDFDFSEKIRKFGRIKIVDSSLALTSPRRIEKWGKIVGAVKYLSIYWLYFCGKKEIANRLGKKMYGPVR